MVNRSFRLPVLAGVAIAVALVRPAHADSGLPLVEAVRRADAAGVRALLQKRVEVNLKDGDGATALHWAAHRDDLPIADLLLAGGAQVDVQNVFGVSPLMLAAQNGSGPMVARLLKAGSDPNLASSTGETPLMTASRTGRVEAIQALLAHKANPNAADTEAGQTALTRAASEGHLDAVKALIAGGADVTQGSKSGFTPLMFAARDGDVELVKTLLAAGAPINATSQPGDSALVVATVRGHVDLAEFLLDKGADPNLAKSGYTALHWTVGRWETDQTHDYPNAGGEWATLIGIPADRKHELMEALVAHGADVNAKMTKAPPRFGIHLFNSGTLVGGNAMFTAAMAADVDAIDFLGKHGADVNVVGTNGSTALMLAAGLARIEGGSVVTDEQSKRAAEAIVKLGFNNFNQVTKQGDTALHAAALQGNNETIKYLASLGSDLNIKNAKGETPLQVATATEFATMIVEHPKTAELIRQLGGTK